MLRLIPLFLFFVAVGLPQCTKWGINPNVPWQLDCISNAVGGSGVGGGSALTTANRIVLVDSAGKVTQSTAISESSPGVLSGFTGIATGNTFTINRADASWSWDAAGGLTPGYLVNSLNVNNQAFDNVGSIALHNTNANGIKKSDRASDAATVALSITGSNAFASAATNLVGGNVTILGGSGASGSAGAANGGNVTLNGGQPFGAGTAGHILLGNTRGAVGIGPGNTSPSGTLHVWDTTASIGVTTTTVRAGAGQAASRLTSQLRPDGTSLGEHYSYSVSDGFIADVWSSNNSNGAVVLPDGVQLSSNSIITWHAGSLTAVNSTASDLVLRRDAANVLAQRNGTNAQAFRVYNTFTDASNNEHFKAAWESNVLALQTVANGSGSARSINLRAGGSLTIGSGAADRWFFDASGHFLANADNAVDIGASGATRPRDAHIARQILLAQGTITASTPFVSHTATWNSGGTTFTNILSNVTDTASASGSLLADFQVGGATKFNISKAGTVSVTGSYVAGATQDFRWTGRSVVQSPADGQLLVANAAGTDFSRLQFGGTTSSFPALKRSGTVIIFQLADDSGPATAQGKFNSSDGSTGHTGMTCTSFKDGLCVAGT